MTASPDVLIVGTGRFARQVCISLAELNEPPRSILVLGRTPKGLRDLVTANNSAGHNSMNTYCYASVLDLTRTVATHARARPTVVVVCSSLHSPWEVSERPSRWTDLLADAGFALSLPLQVVIAVAVSRACAAIDNPPYVINAAYPDVVNAVVRAMDLPILTGVGNIAALEAHLCKALCVDDVARLQILAHHLHLKTPDHLADDVQVSLDGREVLNVGSLLSYARTSPREALNQVSAQMCARLVGHLLQGRAFVGHLPGPSGLVGGYPVVVDGSDVQLRLADAAFDSAVRWNHRMSLKEGVTVLDDQVTFSASVVEAVSSVMSGFPEQIQVDQLDELTEQMLYLRNRERLKPAVASSHGAL